MTTHDRHDAGATHVGAEPTASAPDAAAGGTRRWPRLVAALALTAACTLLAQLMFPWFEPTNLVMVYLLGATIAALRLGRGPACLTAVANVAAFDFFFVRPRFTLAIGDVQYLVTFAVMLVVALLIATLVAHVGAQTRLASAREQRTALLYGMTRELAVTRLPQDLADVAARHVAASFHCDARVLLPDTRGERHAPAAPEDPVPAGALRLPLVIGDRTFGMLEVTPRTARQRLLPEQRRLLESFAEQIALALERVRLAEDAERARIAAASESLRNTLLGSISHDLRTPLAVIAGAASALTDDALERDVQARHDLARSIEGKAQEMSALISNVLDLMRFDSGDVQMRRDWQALDDLVGAALGRSAEALRAHRVTVDLPEDLPTVHCDAPLLTQVLCNLLENGARHTPAGTPLHVAAGVEGTLLQVRVEDGGPGLPPGDPERLFERFQRGRTEGTTGGAGLGLAICRAIVRAHGGDIHANARPGGGACFTFTLPLAEAPARGAVREGAPS